MSDRAVREGWKQGTCGYCGKQALVNGDHVVARTLWNVPARTPAIILACEPCHSRKSVFESSLRDFLVLNPEAMVTASQRQKQKTLSAMIRQKSLYADIFQRALLEPSSQDSVDFDFTRINMGVLHIVRGLHYVENDEPLPESTPMFPQFIPLEQVVNLRQFFNRTPNLVSGSLGSGDTWWQMIAPDPADSDDDTYYWLICFWGKAYFFITVGSEAEPHLEEVGISELARATSVGTVQEE